MLRPWQDGARTQVTSLPLASETFLCNLGGETAPSSGSLGSMPIFPGVRPRIPGFRASNRSLTRETLFIYLGNFICIGLAASDPWLNKEQVVRAPTYSAQPRPHPHHAIGLAMVLVPGSIASGQYFPLPGPHFFPSGKWQNIPQPPCAFPSVLEKFVGWGWVRV